MILKFSEFCSKSAKVNKKKKSLSYFHFVKKCENRIRNRATLQSKYDNFWSCEKKDRKEFNEWNEMKWRDWIHEFIPPVTIKVYRKPVWIGKVFSSFNQIILVSPFHYPPLVGLFYGMKEEGYWLTFIHNNVKELPYQASRCPPRLYSKNWYRYVHR